MKLDTAKINPGAAEPGDQRPDTIELTYVWDAILELKRAVLQLNHELQELKDSLGNNK